MVLDRIDAGRWEHTSSRMAVAEIAAIPDAARRKRVFQLLPSAINEVTAPMWERADELTEAGLGAADAVHVAAAEPLDADVLLTCDDRLIRRCRRISERLSVRVENPKIWLEESDDAKNTG